MVYLYLPDGETPSDVYSETLNLRLELKRVVVMSQGHRKMSEGLHPTLPGSPFNPSQSPLPSFNPNNILHSGELVKSFLMSWR